MSLQIRTDKADQEFSVYIRLRDRKCMRCGREGTPDAKGRPIVGLQNSHYFGRGKENTRFDPQNCDALCFKCHQVWGSEEKEEYREFKIKQLGITGFDNLRKRAMMYAKKDRKLALLAAKALQEELT